MYKINWGSWKKNPTHQQEQYGTILVIIGRNLSEWLQYKVLWHFIAYFENNYISYSWTWNENEAYLKLNTVHIKRHVWYEAQEPSAVMSKWKYITHTEIQYNTKGYSQRFINYIQTYWSIIMDQTYKNIKMQLLITKYIYTLPQASIRKRGKVTESTKIKLNYKLLFALFAHAFICLKSGLKYGTHHLHCVCFVFFNWVCDNT